MTKDQKATIVTVLLIILPVLAVITTMFVIKANKGK